MNTATRLIALLLPGSILWAGGCQSEQCKHSCISSLLRDRAMRQLTDTMDRCDRWVKVHAAEFLLELENPNNVRDAFNAELRLYGDMPQYRIGIWRVLARSSENDKSKRQWIDKIIAAFQQPQGKDRIHAAETLAKLGVPLQGDTRQIAAELTYSRDPALATYTQWALVAGRNGINKTQASKLIALLDSKDESARRIAAYALRYQKSLLPENWPNLTQKALSEPSESGAKIYMLSAAMVTASHSDIKTPDFDKVKSALITAKNSQNKSARYELCMALALCGKNEDLPILLDLMKPKNSIREGIEGYRNLTDEQLFEHPFNADVRSAAAYAILCIDHR